MLLEYKMPLRKTNTSVQHWEKQQHHTYFTTLSGQNTWELKKTLNHRRPKGSLESRALGQTAPSPGVVDFVLQGVVLIYSFPHSLIWNLSQGSGIDYVFSQAAVGKWFLISHLPFD